MKKIAAITFITLLLVGFGGALAQTTDDKTHTLDVRIPDLVMLRITAGDSFDPAANPSVMFDFVTNEGAYMTAIEGGNEVELNRTSDTNFDDIIVLSSQASWQVNVTAAPFGFTGDVVSGEASAGLTLSDVRVAPTGTPGENVERTTAGESFTLEGETEIAQGNRTQGWRSLGISGGDYWLTVNGDEAPGTYTTTVTYTITAP